MPEERIQKVLAAAGVASRRAAEELVAKGRVRVDGQVATIGQKVDPVTSTISVDGTPVGIGVARAYVALHKPGGVTSTTRDRHAETTVLDLIPTALVPDGTRLFPVGRLDVDSEGLILLTNDGEWAERVLHPRFGVEREYAIALAVPLTGDQARALSVGIQLDEGLAKLVGPLRAAAHRRHARPRGHARPAARPAPRLVPRDPRPGLEAPAPAHVRGCRRPDPPPGPRSNWLRAPRRAPFGPRPDAEGARSAGLGHQHLAASHRARAATSAARQNHAMIWSGPIKREVA